MTKSNKKRAGLQKKVSSVFKGVSIPGSKHPVQSPHMTEPSHNTVLPNAVVDDIRHQPGPQTDTALKPTVSANQTDRESTVAVESSIPADVEVSVGGSVEKSASSEESQSIVTSQQEVMYTPTSPAEAMTEQTPAGNESPPVDEPTDETPTEKTAGFTPRVSASRTPESSSLIKKLSQFEESEGAVSDLPSASTGPVFVKSPADQTVSEEAEESSPPASAEMHKTQSSLAKKLAEAEDAANDTAEEDEVATPASKPASRSNSQSQKPKEVRRPQTPPAASAAPKHPLADQLANAVDEGGLLERIKEKLVPADGNPKDKIMIMLIPVLAIVMIFVFRHILYKSPGKTQAEEKKDKKVVAAAKASDEIEWTIPEPLPVITRDPLKLPEPDEPENPDQNSNINANSGAAGTETKTLGLEVRGIVYSKDKASALVGNQIVRAGSKINGITIVKINKDSVELERNGETWIQKVGD